MRRSIGTFAAAVLFAPAAAAQAQGIGQTICQDEVVPTLGTFQPSQHLRVCDSVYIRATTPRPRAAAQAHNGKREHCTI